MTKAAHIMGKYAISKKYILKKLKKSRIEKSGKREEIRRMGKTMLWKLENQMKAGPEGKNYVTMNHGDVIALENQVKRLLKITK